MIPFLLVLLSPFTFRATPMLPATSLLNARSGPADSLVIHFGYNQSTLSAREKAALDSFLVMHKHNVKLIIYGYCDARGAAVYNHKLSTQRANTVAHYLTENGFDGDNFLDVMGLGTNDPVDSDSTEEAWAKNRRVVLIFDQPAGHPETITASVQPATNPATTRTQASPAANSGVPDPAASGSTSPADSSTAAPKRPAYVKSPSIREQLADTNIHVGSKLALKNVNFFGGYHIPLPGTTIVLDTLAQAMLDNPNLRLHIDGYICCLPDSSEGKDAQTGHFDLSIQRAKFVYDYLVNHKVAKERLAYEGHGSNNKLYPEERDQREQALNRRVEITVIAK